MIILNYGEIALFIIYVIAIASILYFALRKSKRKFCKTCKYWNFKVSGNDDICWGNCLCKEANIAKQLKIPMEYRLVIKNADDTYCNDPEMKKYPELYIDTYYAEIAYGCIYHKSN